MTCSDTLKSLLLYWMTVKEIEQRGKVAIQTME